MFIKRVLVAPGPLRAARKCFKPAGEEVSWGIVDPFLCGRADLLVVFLGLAGAAEAPLAVVVVAEMLLSAIAGSAGVLDVTCFLLGACSSSLPVDGGGSRLRPREVLNASINSSCSRASCAKSTSSQLELSSVAAAAA